MCRSDVSPLLSAVFGQPNTSPGPAPSGSRRRRIWELPMRCHCTLVSVCLPLETLRRLVNRAAGCEVLDQYARNQNKGSALLYCDTRVKKRGIVPWE